MSSLKTAQEALEGIGAASPLTTKDVATLQALAALHGRTLIRSHPDDGPQRLFLERFGIAHEIHSFEQLELPL